MPQGLSDAGYEVNVCIGSLPIKLITRDASFSDLIAQRYFGYINYGELSIFELQIELTHPLEAGDDQDLDVRIRGGFWIIQRGDFRAELDLHARCGFIRQSPNPYSLDSILRILHSLILVEEGGFLLHSASAIRNGKAFLFSGPSGAGKTTITRLAPSDAIVLTDEISFIRRVGGEYMAFGTPFSGELARSGANTSAPISGVYMLSQSRENKVREMSGPRVHANLFRNILFFAQDEALVKRIFEVGLEFAHRVPICELNFTPDERVWSLIG